MPDKKLPPKPWNDFWTNNRPRWQKPFFRCEWWCEQISYRLGRWAFIDVLEYIGKLSLLGALILYVWGIPERRDAAENARKAKIFAAWQVINSAIGKPGNAGRAEALQDLNAAGVALAGVSVKGNVIFFQPVSLPRANLVRATFDGVEFRTVDLSGAHLDEARFERVKISRGNFTGAELTHVILNEVEFHECDFTDALFSPNQCKDVRFYGCNFRKARIELGIDLNNVGWEGNYTEKTIVRDTKFRWCDLSEVLIAIPEASWEAVTFADCNVNALRATSGGRPPALENREMNPSVPVPNFAQWKQWLEGNRQKAKDGKPQMYPFMDGSAKSR